MRSAQSVLVAAGIACATVVHAAGGLPLDMLPANARWVLHLDVLDARGPSLSTSPRFRRAAAADSNAFLRVLAVDLKEIVADNPSAAAALVTADSLRLAAGSEGQGVRLKAVMKTDTVETARQAQQMLLMLQGVVLLQGLKNPDVARIARSAQIGVTGTEVSVSVLVPLAEVRRGLAEAKAAAPKAHAPAAAEE